MLVLERKVDQWIVLDGGRIRICVTDISQGRVPKVHLGIIAPADMSIDRDEVYRSKEASRESVRPS